MRSSLEIEFIVRVALVVVRCHSTGIPLSRGMATHRGLRAGRTHKGTPRNLGGLSLPSEMRVGHPRNKPRLAIGLAIDESKHTSQRWYRRARKRSARGTSDKMSELRVVPTKWGNHPEGPHGGKATGAGHENHWRER